MDSMVQFLQFVLLMHGLLFGIWSIALVVITFDFHQLEHVIDSLVFERQILIFVFFDSVMIIGVDAQHWLMKMAIGGAGVGGGGAETSVHIQIVAFEQSF